MLRVYGSVFCSISMLFVYMCVRMPSSPRTIAGVPSGRTALLLHKQDEYNSYMLRVHDCVFCSIPLLFAYMCMRLTCSPRSIARVS